VSVPRAGHSNPSGEEPAAKSTHQSYAVKLRRKVALDPSVNRVWLHTSSQDHPRALPNYHRRGFRTFKAEQVEQD
jgi:hypothetical protein